MTQIHHWWELKTKTRMGGNLELAIFSPMLALLVVSAIFYCATARVNRGARYVRYTTASKVVQLMGPHLSCFNSGEELKQHKPMEVFP